MTTGHRAGTRWPWLVVVLLVVVPIAEIAMIIAVGKVIGGWPTLALLLVESALGAWLVKREGRSTWTALREALATGRMPAGELSDAALVLVGGTLLLTPGFLSDVLGFACVLPGTRSVARRVLTQVVTRKLLAGASRGSWTTYAAGHRPSQPPGAGGATRAARGQDDEIIEGEIL